MSKIAFAREGYISQMVPGPSGTVETAIKSKYNVVEGETYDDGSPMGPVWEWQETTVFLTRDQLAGLFPGDNVELAIAITPASGSL